MKKNIAVDNDTKFLQRNMQRFTWCALAGIALLWLATADHVSAFKIAFVGAPPIHEAITSDAVRTTTAQVNDNFIFNVIQGVENTDITHQLDPRFHFDDSTTGNNGFQAGFTNVASLLNQAENEARQMYCAPGTSCGRINPAFLAPEHITLSDMEDEAAETLWNIGLNPHCTFSSACPADDIIALAADLDADLLTKFDVNPDVDLGDVSTDLREKTGRMEGILNQIHNDSHFHDDVASLTVVADELHAYPAWQHLGHAFHGVQDFFAHSNFIELAAGLAGPPCPPGQSLNCSRTVIGSRPEDQKQFVNSFTSSIQDFTTHFSLASAQTLLSSNGSALQTGYVDWDGDWCYSKYIPVPVSYVGGVRPNANPNPLPGFDFCHYQTTSVPGLNKDEAYQQEHSDDELAHQNFASAHWAATQASRALWTGFLGDLGGQPLLTSLGYSTAPVSHANVWRIVRDYHEHDGGFGGKGDDQLNGGLLILGAADCVLQNVEVQVLNKRQEVVAVAARGGAAVGSAGFPTWGADISKSGEGTKSLAVNVHWWYDLGVAVRYQLQYTFGSPSGGQCSAAWH